MIWLDMRPVPGKLRRKAMETKHFVPCPFCRGGAVLNHSRRNPKYPMWWVSCESCGASTRAHSAEENAVKAWNNGKEVEKWLSGSR